MKHGSRTPWGKADHVVPTADGVWQVGTPGHGGFKLDRARNAQIDARWRKQGGWYEEDVEWAIVMFTFPEIEKDPKEGVQARCILKNYYPHLYAAITGNPVSLAESRVLRREAAEAANRDKFVARSAFGDWHPKVPAGFVGVVARRASSEEERFFLVLDAEYEQRAEFGFVVDEARHQSWTGPT
jgi:Domain of unknown function (DUF7007)